MWKELVESMNRLRKSVEFVLIQLFFFEFVQLYRHCINFLIFCCFFCFVHLFFCGFIKVVNFIHKFFFFLIEKYVNYNVPYWGKQKKVAKKSDHFLEWWVGFVQHSTKLYSIFDIKSMRINLFPLDKVLHILFTSGNQNVSMQCILFY